MCLPPSLSILELMPCILPCCCRKNEFSFHGWFWAHLFSWTSRLQTNTILLSYYRTFSTCEWSGIPVITTVFLVFQTDPSHRLDEFCVSWILMHFCDQSTSTYTPVVIFEFEAVMTYIAASIFTYSTGMLNHSCSFFSTTFWYIIFSSRNLRTYTGFSSAIKTALSLY